MLFKRFSVTEYPHPIMPLDQYLYVIIACRVPVGNVVQLPHVIKEQFSCVLRKFVKFFKRHLYHPTPLCVFQIQASLVCVSFDGQIQDGIILINPHVSDTNFLSGTLPHALLSVLTQFMNPCCCIVPPSKYNHILP